MSKLLDEARNEATHAEATCQEGDHYDIGYLSAWNDAAALIEEHEQTELTKEQKRVYSLLVQTYSHYQRCFPQDNDNFICSLGDLELKNDTNVIPALRKFLNEV